MKAKKTKDFNKRISLLLSIVLVLIIAITPISYASELSSQISVESTNNQTTQNNQNNQNQQQNSNQRQQEQRHSDNLDTTQDVPLNLTNITNRNNTNNSIDNNTQTNQVRNEVTMPVISTEIQNSAPPKINDFEEVEDPLGIHADSCILIEPDSTKVLYEKNSAKKVYPASTTKLLTAILTTEFVNDLNEKALVSYYAVKSVPPTYSIANLQPGEQVSINDLLNSLLVGSANDSAYVLAQYIINHGNNFPYDESYDSAKNFNNSIEQFAELMNRRAKELGCKDSNFRNPNGIHDDFHYSTARDLAIIGRTAYRNQKIREISTKLEYTLQDSSVYRPTPRTMKQTNNLLYPDKSSYYEYANGLKTGYTEAAEYCIVASSSKDDFDLIAVVLHSDNISDDNISREADCKKLFEYGYNTFLKTKIVEKDAVISTINVKNGNKTLSDLNLLSSKEISAILKNKEIYNFSPTIKLTKTEAPIRKGEIIGTATYTIDNVDYKVDLIAEHDVSIYSYSTYVFIALGVLLIIAVVAIILTSVILKDD